MEVDDTVRVKVEVEDEDGLEWKPNTELDLDKEIEGCSGRKGEEEEGSEEEAPNNTDPSETSVNKKLLELAAAIQRDAEKMDLLSLLQNLATLKKEAEEMLDASEKGKEDGKQQRGKRKQQKPHSKEQRRMERVRRSAGSLTPLEVHRRFASQLSAEGETAVLEEALSALEEGSAFRRVLFKRRFTCSTLVADVEELFKPWRDTRLTLITHVKIGRIIHLLDRSRLYLLDLGYPVLNWKQVTETYFGRKNTFFMRRRYFASVVRKMPRLLFANGPSTDLETYQPQLERLTTEDAFAEAASFWRGEGQGDDSLLSRPPVREEEYLEVDLSEAEAGAIGILILPEHLREGAYYTNKSMGTRGQRTSDLAKAMADIKIKTRGAHVPTKVFVTAEGFSFTEPSAGPGKSCEVSTPVDAEEEEWVWKRLRR